MPRQRLRIEGSSVATAVGRLLVALLGAAIAYYGLMVMLLAFKVGPGTVNDISGFRTAFDYLSGLTAGDISSSDRLIVAIVAVVLALIALFLLWRGLPRPHLARHEVKVSETELGTTEIGPRAMERAVEGGGARASRGGRGAGAPGRRRHRAFGHRGRGLRSRKDPAGGRAARPREPRQTRA